MKINTLVRHDVAPELREYLEKVNTHNCTEILGDHIMIVVDDIDYLVSDIRKIARESEKINRVYKEVGFPWLARDILDRKTVVEKGALCYPNKTKLRREVENELGSLISDSEYGEILEATAKDILVNRLAQNKPTSWNDIIKIAAQCAKALQRCGR